MVSPQKENGFLSIANEIVDELMKVNLSAYEMRVLWFILRKTYGFNKKTDWMALSQFAKGTNLDRRLVHRTLKKLSSKQMIVIHRDDKFRIRYGFQKNYNRWVVSSKEMTSVIHRDDQVSSIEMNTKDTIQKTVKDLSLGVVKKNGKCPYQKMVDCYHEILPELTEVRKMTDKRKQQSKKVWMDKDMDQDIEKWRSYLDHIRKSKFLMGKSGKWVADFEWITNYNNFVKIIEGKYHG